ncbi:hypothetical protein ABZY42_24425 [Streptomyces sp. NPDC006622]|uniref:hypothetical protein n=1 Tax=Streptomyces sp. NPDC006622 TaxID=3155459 RepID=UPI0033B6BF5F
MSCFLYGGDRIVTLPGHPEPAARPGLRVRRTPGVLDFLPDGEAARDVVRRVMAAVPSNSHLVLTHPTHDSPLGGERQIPAAGRFSAPWTPPAGSTGSPRTRKV